MNDRFGTAPEAIYNVCDTLRLRWEAKIIGFERIILKNDSMLAYFPSQADSPYYNSEMFKAVLYYLKTNFGTCEITERKERLSMRIKNIKSIKEALEICKEINSGHLHQQ